jgi:Mor family transcriptional regulator
LNSQNPWIEDITVEDLPNEDLKIVAALVGLDTAVKMMCELPGIVISIPKNATLGAKIKYIKKHYDGSKKSRYELAKACGVSENYIYKIIRKALNSKA